MISEVHKPLTKVDMKQEWHRVYCHRPRIIEMDSQWTECNFKGQKYFYVHKEWIWRKLIHKAGCIYPEWIYKFD